MAEKIWPRIRHLGFEFAQAAFERELFECGSAFGKKDELQRIVGPIGERNFNRRHAEFFYGFQSDAINVGGGRFLHPLREIADAQIFDGRVCVEIEFAWDAGEVAGVGSGNCAENEDCIFDRARHRAEFVERPAERHRAGARDAAEGGAQSCDAAAHRRTDNAAAGFAADGKTDETCRGCRTRASAGAGGAFFQQPRIHRLAAEPNVVQRQRAKAEFCEEHGAGVMQALDDGSVGGRNAIAEWFGAVGRANAGGIKQIFAAPRNAVERAAIFSGSDFGVCLLRLREGEVFCQRDDATELGIETLDSFPINLCQALGRKLARFDPAGEFGERREGDVVFFIGEWAGIGIGAKKCLARGSAFVAWENRIPLRIRCNWRLDRDFARADAKFVDRR